jgi:uncharacterized membrane protein YfcA
MLPLAVGFALTGLVGASLGVLGAGGSIVMLPVLVYVMRIEPHAAVPLSLAIVGATSIAGAAVRSRGGDIQWPTAAMFGGAALAGAYLGGTLTALVPAPVLLLTFGALLVLVGARMGIGRADPEGRDRPGRRRPFAMLAAGAFVGGLTGFLGVGGGFLIVPALMAAGGLHIRQAMSTSLVIIATSSAAGLAGHLARGTTVPVGLVSGLTLAAVAGMALGLRAADQASHQQLRRGFAVFVAIVGTALVIANAPAAIRLLD